MTHPDPRTPADSLLHRSAGDVGATSLEEVRRDESRTATGRDDAMTRSEERLVAATEVYEVGRARLRKYVVTEQVQITVEVRREELRLERADIAPGTQDMVLDPDVFGPSEVFARPEGGPIFEVTLHEERPVVTTEIVPVERVRLVKVVQTDNQVMTGVVRKERIELEEPGRTPTVLD